MADDFADKIRQVKEANDIVDVVGSYLTLRPAGKAYKGLCPFHDDRRPSLTVNREWQNFNCWACQKKGSVFDFVMEFEKVSFREALELLAQRAGISLENSARFQQNSERAVMLESVRWAEQQFQHCLLEADEGEGARKYLGERRLTGETVRKYGLGFAPPAGDWLAQRARSANLSLEVLEAVGLIRPRKEGRGYFDFFRDRVMFPIRDAQGRTVGFAGRILPTSPQVGRAGKYVNTSETPLFHKGELLYGLDQAKQAAARAGYLAVVEGYTDVLMAHQLGVHQVVAPMGTALTLQHVKQIRRIVPQAVLVFDADAGGSTGVDRALEIIASQDLSLRIATLPEGLDPFDLLVQRGVDAFTLALTNAQDVLEFKLKVVCEDPAFQGVEGQRRAVDEVLRIIALGSDLTRSEDQLKHELMLTRIGQRFGVKEETLWARLRQLRAARQTEAPAPDKKEESDSNAPVRQAPAKRHERELIGVLLSDPQLVKELRRHLPAEEIEHPGLRQLLATMYRVDLEGETPTLDHLRARIDNPALLAKAAELQQLSESYKDRRRALDDLLRRFAEIREAAHKQQIQQQLHAAEDHGAAVELLRQLQKRTES